MAAKKTQQPLINQFKSSPVMNKINKAIKETFDGLNDWLDVGLLLMILTGVYGKQRKGSIYKRNRRNGGFSSAFVNKPYKGKNFINNPKAVWATVFDYTKMSVGQNNGKWISHAYSFGEKKGTDYREELFEALNYKFGKGVTQGKKLREHSYLTEFKKTYAKQEAINQRLILLGKRNGLDLYKK